MKKIAFMLAAVCLATAAFAQTSFGIKAGPNFSSYSVKTGGTKETGKIIAGLSGGVYATVPIARKFNIQPSLMYAGKGGKGKEFDTKVRLNYLTLPVIVLFKPGMSGGSGSWMVGAGPYIGYGLSGKITRGVNDSTSAFAYSSDPFKKQGAADALLRRFDLGGDVELGYETAYGFNISLNGAFGVNNIMNHGNSDNFMHNTSFSIMIGYIWGKD